MPPPPEYVGRSTAECVENVHCLVPAVLCLSVQRMSRTEARGGQLFILSWTQRGGGQTGFLGGKSWNSSLHFTQYTTEKNSFVRFMLAEAALGITTLRAGTIDGGP